ncbi:MAG: sigma-70 family RNA polymerase sigma factor [Clostridia bacterium]|nr:sigma-70 family RNA polymerase sigma factor [Clostridia bacterium]
MEDRQIVELYWARDEKAIGETDKKYGRYCHYIAHHILGNDEDAKEVVNDTYLKTWNTVPPHKPDPLKPYVGTISRQLALDAYRAQHAQKRGGQVPFVLDELIGCIPNKDSGADIGESVALSDALSRFLRSLPPRNRNIFVRRYFYMSTIEEIAQDFAARPNAVTMLLLRTRRNLAKFLNKVGFEI